MGIVLRGMTWSHPRGYDPLVACAELWRETTGVAIAWDKRSLQDFEAYPVEDLARRYDLIVIDHPHVGQITREGCLKPFDDPARAAERKALERASVGPSYRELPLAGAAMGAADRRGDAGPGLAARSDRRASASLERRARARARRRGALSDAPAPFADGPLYADRQSRPALRGRRAGSRRR